MTTLTLTKGNISVFVDDTNVDDSGYFHDGNPYIVVSGAVSVTGYTPVRTVSAGVNDSLRNGAMLNPRGNQRKQGVDGRYQSYQNFTAAVTDVITCTAHGFVDGQVVTVDSTTTLPAGLSRSTNYWVRDKTTDTFKLAATSGGAAIDITSTGTGTHWVIPCVVTPISLDAGDVLVIGRSSSSSGQQQPRTSYFNLPGRSNTDEMLVLTVFDVVPAGLTLGADTLFRPPAVGSPATRLSATSFYAISQIQWSLLPTMPSARVPATTPPYAYLLALFADFCGEIVDAWDRDQTVPNFQNPGYGQYLSAAISQAMLKTLEPGSVTGTVDTSDRMKLAQKLVQWAIDLWAAFQDGRDLSTAGGGHGQEWKALIMFAGVLLGNTSMKDPETALGAERFKVDKQYISSGSVSWWGPKWKWAFGADAAHTNYQHTNPSTWPALTSAHDTPPFFERYRGGGSSATIRGQALVMLAMGLQDTWSKEAVGFLSLVGEPVPPLVLSEVVAAGVIDGYHDQDQGWAASYREYCRDGWRALRYTDGFMLEPWIEALGYTVGQPLLVCHDVPAWSGSILLEVITGPPALVTSTELRIGLPRATPIDESGASIWVETVTTSDFGNPNAYGYKATTASIPAAPGGVAQQELLVAIQVVFTMSNGTKRATNALTFWLRP